MNEYIIKQNEKVYSHIAANDINEIILLNSSKTKNYSIGTNLQIVCEQNENEKIDVVITNLFYFDTVMDALLMIGKNNIFYKSKLSLTQIEDKILTVIKAADVEKNGVVVVEFSKL